MKITKNAQTSVDRLKNNIVERKDQIYKCLSGYELKSVIDDEVERSISTLSGVIKELSSLKGPKYDVTMSTFFPLNLPLYSLILFAVVPSVMCKRVHVRVPHQMRDVMGRLFEVLSVADLFPTIYLHSETRNVFNKVYARQSDTVLFTGRYENAENIRKYCKDSLFIYNGSGINPVVIYKDANIQKAVKKVIEMRLYNSGQDCAGPDVIFVAAPVMKDFIARLISDLKNAEVGPIMRKEYVQKLCDYLKKVDRHVLLGGNIDKKTNTVSPIVILRKSDEYTDDYHEFFAPVFNLVSFTSKKDLQAHTCSKRFLERSMYLSYFGNCSDISKISPNTINLDNQIINDVEQGNEPYGGFGKKANYVAFAGKKAVRPILISREIDTFFNDFIIR